jgi:hypoxanthine phosphoribosyltransferase
MKKSYFHKSEIDTALFEITKYIAMNKIEVDQIVGLTRGGLVPAVMLSHYIEKPMIALNKDFKSDELISEGTVLVVDEINDTGTTLMALDKTLRENYPNLKIKYAVFIDNESSTFKNVDVYYRKINKSKDPSWIVFWWEGWWKPYF